MIYQPKVQDLRKKQKNSNNFLVETEFPEETLVLLSFYYETNLLVFLMVTTPKNWFSQSKFVPSSRNISTKDKDQNKKIYTGKK